MLDSLEDYDTDDQECIMTTLSAVQKMGWNHSSKDPFQFHIILGKVIREKDTKIKEVENTLDKQIDQKEQNEYEISKLKNDLKYEKDINEEVEIELKRKEDQIDHLASCVKNRDEIAESLTDAFGEKNDEIEMLKKECMTLETQVGKKNFLQKKLNVQNNVIEELQSNLNNVEKRSQDKNTNAIESLMKEMEQFERKK